MASSGTKLPAIPPIPSNTDPQLKTYLNAVDEALKVRLGRVGDPKDRAITVRELIDSGLAENFLEEPFNPNAGTPPNTFVPIDGLVDLAVPPDVTSLAGAGTFQKIILSWDLAQFGNFAFTEVWRHTSNDLGSAIRIDTTRAQVWSDTVDFNSNFYYWVRHVSTSNIVGQFAGAINVTTSKITDANADTVISAGAIDAAEIKAGAVTTDKITASAITADKIATSAVTTAKIQAGAITAASAILADSSITDAKISNLSATKILASTLDVASKGALGSAGNIAAGTGQISQSTNSTGNVNKFFATSGSLTEYLTSVPYHLNSSGNSLSEVANITFTTTSRSKQYVFLAHHGVNGVFDGDEEKVIVITICDSSGTPLSGSTGGTYQYVSGASANDIFTLAHQITLATSTTFIAKMYAGTKNATIAADLGLSTSSLRISGVLMVFGLGL